MISIDTEQFSSSVKVFTAHFKGFFMPSRIPVPIFLFHLNLLFFSHRNLTTEDSLPPGQILVGVFFSLWVLLPLYVMYPELPLATSSFCSFLCADPVSPFKHLEGKLGVHLDLDIPGTLQQRWRATQGSSPVLLYWTQSHDSFIMIRIISTVSLIITNIM